MKKASFFFLLFLIGSCIEPYNFVVREKSPALVIEAMITDKSFDDTQSYPSDGRYFTVKLSTTADVTNTRVVPVSNAAVILENDQGATWNYEETVPGTYSLLDPSFKASPGIQYKLVINSGDDIFESAWVSLPTQNVSAMNDITFTETTKDVFRVEAGENVLRTIKGIEPEVTIAPNNDANTIYYRWDYESTWIYCAPLIPKSSAVGTCWATSPYYFNDYALQLDRVGGYKKSLFFIETVRNVKLFEKFSLLVKQYQLTPDYYFFWDEMKSRASAEGLAERPPYNLKTNYTCITSDKKVYGYFGVATEQAKRWYFTLKDLSYYVPNTLKDDCLVDYGGPPAPECLDCRQYSDGIATTQKPVWWQK